MHKLTDFRETPRSRKEIAFCVTCGKDVAVIRRPKVGGGFNRRCESELKARSKRDRQNERKQERKAAERAQLLLEQEAAYLWRYIAYHRANFCCEVCGVRMEPGVNGLQAHHLINRSQSGRLHYDPANSQALCYKCHFRAGKDAIWALSFAEIREPGLSAYLLAERRIIKARPFEEDLDRLRKTASIYGIDMASQQEAA